MMVAVSKVVQFQLAAFVLVFAASTVAGAACCWWRHVTSSTDVILILATGLRSHLSQ